jgi:hypothetical protein
MLHIFDVGVNPPACLVGLPSHERSIHMATKSAKSTDAAPVTTAKWDLDSLSDRGLDLLIAKAQSIRSARRQAQRAQADQARAQKAQSVTLPAIRAAVLKYGWTDGLRKQAERLGLDVQELELHPAD